MNPVEQDLNNRKDDIEKELEGMFKVNMKRVDWDVPEADDQKAAEILIDILEKKLIQIKQDVADGKYKYY